jgi:uncharacterized protein
MSPKRFVLPLFVLLLCSGARAQAQDPTVLDLMESAWSQGADAALTEYDALPSADRLPSLLVSVADQLFWTGKHREATELLARAEQEAPLLTEVRFQQARAALQRADRAAALSAFRSGLAIVDRDTSLSEDARGSFRRRLENRIAFLDRDQELLSRSGPYSRPDGGVLLFKFDPYINTFPSLVDMATGTVRLLYPSGPTALEWRDEQGLAIGEVTFEGGAGNLGTLVVRGGHGEVGAAGLGIEQETLRFEVHGATIEGTLFRPQDAGPIPAVVLTHGAGLSSRFNLATEALAYASAGIAAFVYDKPGLGRSVGSNWLLLSIEDQAAYVTRAVDLLRSRADIAHVGVWGFSQGGWVAPIVAARNPAVAFVVMVSGAGVSPQEQSNQAVALRLESAGFTSEHVEEAIQHLRTVWARVNSGATVADLNELYASTQTTPWGSQVRRLTFQWELDWWRENEVDASVALRALRVPVLALFGEVDLAVPPSSNVPLLARYLAESATGDYTIAVLPAADHQMMRDDGYHPLYLVEMVGWVASRFAEARSASVH